MSEREWQIEKMGQWTKGKSADTFGPIGPYIITKDEIKNVQNLKMGLDVNGKKMQNGNHQTYRFFEGFKQNGLQIRIQRIF